MSALRVLAVGGCRPNFVKLGPLLREMDARPGVDPLFVHTGQHYDGAMSGVFLRELELRAPDAFLDVRSGSHAVQTARVMERMEAVLDEHRPDVVLVLGDVNSTVAAALTAVKMGFPVAHVEAGLRSFDREMPEEINRLVTDSISDLLFATEPSAVANLHREGVDPERVFLVGNVMVDALLGSLERIARSNVLERFDVGPRAYAVLTLHRPENVEDPVRVERIFAAVEELERRVPIVFPVHPRARERFARTGQLARIEAAPNVRLAAPLGYLDFLRLVRDAAFVMTDSGGLQEEATVLDVPCLTLRCGTERPVTLTSGTNRIVGTDTATIVESAREALRGEWPSARRPESWDGRAAKRIVDTLVDGTQKLRESYRALRERTLCERQLPTSV